MSYVFRKRLRKIWLLVTRCTKRTLLWQRIGECRGLKGPVDVASRWPMNPGLVSGTIGEEVTFLSTRSCRPWGKNACIVNGGWNLPYAIRPLGAAGVWEGNYFSDSSPGDVYRGARKEPEAPAQKANRSFQTLWGLKVVFSLLSML